MTKNNKALVQTSRITCRTLTDYLGPVGFKTKQHPESFFLHTKIKSHAIPISGIPIEKTANKSNLNMQNSSQNTGSTVDDIFWTSIYL